MRLHGPEQCHEGHTCTLCGELKPLSDFPPTPRMRCGRRPYCKPCANAARVEFNRAHRPEHRVYRRAFEKRNQVRRRALVLAHYGGETPTCACCGVTDDVFLTIDHVEGGGRRHIRSLNGHFYSWLIANDYPPGFQVLCWNCNVAKYRGGCPHKMAAMARLESKRKK